MVDTGGLEGPTSGAIEAPAGLTPLELRAAEEARRAMVEHLGKRPVLTMDQMAEMTDLRPRLEKEIKLPHDTRGEKNRIYFFSIDGRLRGNVFKGCLLGGECMMVQAQSFESALKIAKDGLHDTLAVAREYVAELTRSQVMVSPLDHSLMNIDIGGRRSGAEVNQRGDLATDPKLKAMILHRIAGKPWRW